MTRNQIGSGTSNDLENIQIHEISYNGDSHYFATYINPNQEVRMRELDLVAGGIDEDSRRGFFSNLKNAVEERSTILPVPPTHKPSSGKEPKKEDYHREIRIELVKGLGRKEIVAFSPDDIFQTVANRHYDADNEQTKQRFFVSEIKMRLEKQKTEALQGMVSYLTKKNEQLEESLKLFQNEGQEDNYVEVDLIQTEIQPKTKTAEVATQTEVRNEASNYLQVDPSRQVDHSRKRSLPPTPQGVSGQTGKKVGDSENQQFNR